MGAVDWKLVCSTSALAAILSIGTSLAGLPEVEPNDATEEDLK
ncbi:holin [Solobacterium moorei]